MNVGGSRGSGDSTNTPELSSATSITPKSNRGSVSLASPSYFTPATSTSLAGSDLQWVTDCRLAEVGN